MDAIEAGFHSHKDELAILPARHKKALNEEATIHRVVYG